MCCRARSTSFLVVILIAAFGPASCESSPDGPPLPHHDAEATEPDRRSPTDECDGGDPKQERHGTNCGCCHNDFGISGSVQEGSGLGRIRVQDATGFTLDIAVNPYGNFFRHVELTPPLRAWAVLENGEELMMEGDANGNCNGCHAEDAELGLLGSDLGEP